MNKKLPVQSYSKNDAISSVRKHYCTLGIEKIRFWSNVFSSKCSISVNSRWSNLPTTIRQPTSTYFTIKAKTKS